MRLSKIPGVLYCPETKEISAEKDCTDEQYTDYEGYVFLSDSEFCQTSEASLEDEDDSHELLCRIMQGLENDSKEQTFTVGGVSFEMVSVAGGTFTMGASAKDRIACKDESPAHEVTLSSYYIGKMEVTQQLWEAVMGSNPSYFRGDNLPVEQVSWNDCQKFIAKLNLVTGKYFRLPTEAEWEYAARGGNRSKGYLYSGSKNIDETTWHKNNSERSTHPVGTKPPNELGLYDMSGNVWEWCADWYGDYRDWAQTDPVGPESGSKRVRRGGSWGNEARSCRSSNRFGVYPTFRNSRLGLRLAL